MRRAACRLRAWSGTRSRSAGAFLAQRDADAALAAAQAIVDAVSLLERHPLIGRPVENGLRELVISRGQTGYVALYDYLETIDAVVVLAVRHQREAGFAQDK